MFLILFFIGVVLRLWMLLRGHAFWGDEWASILIAKAPLKAGIFYCIQDVHPPLYFVLLHESIRFFGFNEIAFRLPSWIAGVGVIVGVYFLAKEYYEKRTALFAAFFVSISPYFIHLTNEIRNHGLPVLFYTWGTYFFLRMTRAARPAKWGIVYGLTAAAAIYTTHFSWFWFGVIAGAHAWMVWVKQTPKKTLWFQGVVFVVCVPALLLCLYHFYNTCFPFNESISCRDEMLFSRPWILPRKILCIYWSSLVGPFFDINFNKDVLHYFKTSWSFCFSALCFAIAGGLIAWRFFKSELKEKFIAIAILSFPVIVVILDHSRLKSRYFGFVAIFIILWLAKSVTTLKNRAFLLLFLSLFSVALFRESLRAIYLPADIESKDDFEGGFRYVLEHAGENDAIAKPNSIMDYYQKKLNLSTKATFVDMRDFNGRHGTQKFSRVWFIAMNLVQTEAINDLDERLIRLGFYQAKNHVFFGSQSPDYVVKMFSVRQDDIVDI